MRRLPVNEDDHTERRVEASKRDAVDFMTVKGRDKWKRHGEHFNGSDKQRNY